MSTSIEVITTHLQDISTKQQLMFEKMGELYPELNNSVNVISRKDIEHLFTHHILHSLFIIKILQFKDGASILDLGTGGGFPGLPLAIMYPQVHFTLVDGRRKKIGVVKEVVEKLGLKNVQAQQIRAEEIKKQKFDFVVCRAVASVDKLLPWTRRLLKEKQMHAYPNGLFTWKGGNPKKETSLLPHYEYSEIFPLKDYTELDYFKEKYIMYVQG